MGWAKNSIPPEQAGNPIIIIQTALTQKEHHHNIFTISEWYFNLIVWKYIFVLLENNAFLAVLDR